MGKKNEKKMGTRAYRLEDVGVPSAHSAAEMVAAKALQNAINKINRAKKEGKTCCYITDSTTRGGLPKLAIQKLVDAGYDIHYSHYINLDTWFIKASWIDGCGGRIYNDNIIGCVQATIDEMFE